MLWKSFIGEDEINFIDISQNEPADNAEVLPVPALQPHAQSGSTLPAKEEPHAESGSSLPAKEEPHAESGSSPPAKEVSEKMIS